MRRLYPLPAAHRKAVLTFVALALAAALLQSLVNLPSQLSVGEQLFGLEAGLPLYSALAVLERVGAAALAYALARLLVQTDSRAWLALGALLALPLLAELARLAGGTWALLVLALMLRRWLSLPVTVGVAAALLGAALLPQLSEGVWQVAGVSLEITERITREEALTAAFRTASLLGFALFAFELYLRLMQERTRLGRLASARTGPQARAGIASSRRNVPPLPASCTTR